MGLHGLGVGRADAVLAALDRVEEGAVLAPDRVAVGAAHRAAAADVDHEVVVGQLDRQRVGEDVQADAVAPAQQAGGREVGDGARGEAQGRRSRRSATSRPGKSSRGRAGREAEDLGDVAGEEAGEVDDVGRLLDDLAAGAVLAPPPVGRRRLVEPVAGHQVRGVVGEQPPRLVDGIEIAPVVADGGDEPGAAHGRVDLAGEGGVEGDRLLDEERQAGARWRRAPGAPWAKGGTQIQSASRSSAASIVLVRREGPGAGALGGGCGARPRRGRRCRRW